MGLRHSAEIQLLLPAVADGAVYLAALDNKLYAFDAQTGAVRWSTPAGVGGGLKAPAVANGTVYFQTDRSVYALDTVTGAIRWGFSSPFLSSSSVSTPAVANGVVYAGPYALDAQTGAVKWRCDACNATGTPVVAEGNLYITSTEARGSARLFAFQSVRASIFFPVILQGAAAW